MERIMGKGGCWRVRAIVGALLLIAASTLAAPSSVAAQDTNVELVDLTFDYDDAGHAVVSMNVRPTTSTDIATVEHEFLPVFDGSASKRVILSGGPAGSVFTIEGTGVDDQPLEPGFYNVGVWVTDVRDRVSFERLAFDLPSAPAVTLVRTADDAIDVRWTEPEYGFPTAYEVRVSDVFNTQTRTMNSSARSASFDQLNQGGLVRVSVTAVSEAILFDSRFVGRPTGTAEIALPDSPPSAIQNLVVSEDPIINSVIWRWDPPVQAVHRYEPTGYRVAVDPGDGLPFDFEVSADQRLPISTPMVAGRRYQISVTPMSPAGDGPTTTAVFDAPPPPDPAGPAVPDATAPTVQLTAPESVSRFGSATLQYSCDDNVAVASCVGFVNGQPIASGQRIPTALRGVNTITVEALDSAGLETVMEQTVDVDWSLTGRYAGVSGVEGVVARYYAATFERLPDSGGFAFWVDMLSNDPSQAGFVSQFFVTSPEFVSTYGDITDEQFVDRIYRNVLGREAEPGGRAFWLDQLATGTRDRGGIMAFFADSPEHREITGTS